MGVETELFRVKGRAVKLVKNGVPWCKNVYNQGITISLDVGPAGLLSPICHVAKGLEGSIVVVCLYVPLSQLSAASEPLAWFDS